MPTRYYFKQNANRGLIPISDDNFKMKQTTTISTSCVPYYVNKKIILISEFKYCQSRGSYRFERKSVTRTNMMNLLKCSKSCKPQDDCMYWQFETRKKVCIKIPHTSLRLDGETEIGKFVKGTAYCKPDSYKGILGCT